MVVLRSRAEIETIRRACRIVAQVLERLRALVEPGVTTGELDRRAEEWARSMGAEPAFKGYAVGGRVYPASLCVSINEEVVHGMPSADRMLREGDIVGLDFGVVYEGYYGDGAVTVPVGGVRPDAERLMRVTREALEKGIERMEVGKRIRDVSAAIQEHAESHGYSVVREFVGHGVGRSMHEEPQVPNYVDPKCNQRLRPGMTLAIEPMVNAGGPDTRVLDDGWTVVTADGQWSAHFEHTVLVTEGEPEILTCPEKTLSISKAG